MPIPILGKKNAEEEVLEGITCKSLKTGKAHFPVDMKDGKPIVGSVTELHLAVQFRFVLRVPLPLGDKEEGAHLLDMLLREGFQPEWDRTQQSLAQLQKNLNKAAEIAVKTEYAERNAQAAREKGG